MELVKLENLRDQIRIRIVMHKEYMCGYYMQPDSEYIKGFIDARKLEIIFLEKHLMAIEKEIEDHSDTKVAKALGLEMVDCDCEECKALSLKAKKIADTLFSAIKIKSRFDFEGKFDGDLQELQELCFKLEDDISEIEKKDESASDMKQKLDETLSKVKDILIEFHVPGSKYWSEVHEIVEDCYRLQDHIREDLRERIKERYCQEMPNKKYKDESLSNPANWSPVHEYHCYTYRDRMEDLKEKNQKYKIISFIKDAPFSYITHEGFDSLDSAKEHMIKMLNRGSDIFKVEVREECSNELIETHAMV